jgi:predicted transcriptional regulator
MVSNGDRFEAAYNKIDALLRKKIDATRAIAFSAIVIEAAKKDPTIRAYKDDLLEYGDLRNAIVHDRGTSPILLADPRAAAVVNIEKIWDRLSHPRKLRSLTRRGSLHVFTVDAKLTELLSYMREKDFSQVIAVQNQKYLIVSTEGLAHWLEAKSKEEIIDLSETRVGDVIVFEPKDSCRYLSADDTIDRAREVFATDVGKRIFSVLVTEHGRPTETPINILTPWDFVTGAFK